LTVEDLASRYEAKGIASRSSQPRTLFIGTPPPAERLDETLTLIDYSGLPPEHTHNGGPVAAYRQPRIQVVARGRDPLAVRHLAERAFVESQVANETVGEAFYLSIQPQQDPFDMGLDGNNRTRNGFNVLAYRRA
jgi:hypothetical protein